LKPIDLVLANLSFEFDRRSQSSFSLASDDSGAGGWGRRQATGAWIQLALRARDRDDFFGQFSGFVNSFRVADIDRGRRSRLGSSFANDHLDESLPI